MGRPKLLWIGIAAVEFGCGVWSLHFVAMLAFMPGMQVSYDVVATVSSVVIAIAGSFCSFCLATSSRRDPWTAVWGAVLLTLAVGGMHYTGVAAMRLEGIFQLDPTYVLSSFGLGAVFSTGAVIAMAQLHTTSRQALATVLMSAAICSIHFVGMSAMTLQVGAAGSLPPAWLGSKALAVVVATSSIALVLLSLTLAIVDQLLSDRACQEKARLRKLTAVSFEGLIIEQHGIVVDANDRICEFSGYAMADIIGKPVDAILAPEDEPDNAARQPREGSYTLRRACGSTMPVELLAQAIAFDGGDATAVAIRDLTARHDTEAALHRLAHHDALTGLANRVLLDTRMRQAFEGTQLPLRRGAVLCLDLDRFKPVNDLLGHAAGDKHADRRLAPPGGPVAPIRYAGSRRR